MQDFKVCSSCGYAWPNRDAFLSDGSLRLIGYQADLDRLEEGQMLFTHGARRCRTTLAISARDFLDLYTGPRCAERKTMAPECPRYCLEETQLERCGALCECAFVREVVYLVKSRLEKVARGSR